MSAKPARILLVDDEEQLLRLMSSYLGRLGHDVLSASTAPDALAKFGREPDGFDLVILDMTMPEMSGKEIYEQMLQHNARIRVLVCSGYPFEPKSLAPEFQKQFGFVQKPFLPNMLAKAVEELLKKKI
jgi:DNA-binding NtrC family response regulator